MNVQLATLDILVNEAHFDPPVARAIGAAIETEVRSAQFITLPMLDIRLADLRSALELKIAQLDTKLEAFRSQLELKLGQLEIKIDLKLAEMENRLLLKMATLQAAGIGVLFALLRAMP